MSRSLRVLVVEDDPAVSHLLAEALAAAGHSPHTATSGTSGLRLAHEVEADLVILDVNLPELTGFEVLERLRLRRPGTAVLMLSARDTLEDIVRGLDLGADDYLAKPFKLDELLARVRAVARRRGPTEETRLVFGDLEMDLVQHRVTRAGAPVRLTPKEFKLLRSLVRSGGGIVTRAELLEQVWGLGFEPGTGIVNVHLSNLRRKLDRAGRPGLIATERGVGYRLQPPNPQPL